MINLNSRILLFVFVLLFLFACSENKGAKKVDADVLDPSQSLNTAFDGKIFSIPSPFQTALLIKELNLPFTADILNDVSNLERYNSEYLQALNLGVFGTDLGYVSVYEQNAVAIKYLASVQRLTEKLGLDAAFDKQFMLRFEKNLSDQDSMLMIVSEAFKKSDYFLKNADRKSTSALILTGGWIESMYIASELNILKSSPKLVERIGEQQLTLTSVIEILTEYNESGKNSSLIQDLTDLQFFFDKIEFKYTFKDPTTDEKKKMTTFNHDLEIKIDTDILNQISMKIRSIREKIIA